MQSHQISLHSTERFWLWGKSVKCIRCVTTCIEVDGSSNRPRSIPVRVLLPHEVLHSLAHSGSFAFQSLMLGNLDTETRVDFWKHVSTLPPWEGHPVIRAGGWDKLIGCSIHGDGAQMFNEDEYFVWSWSSIFASSGCIKDFLLVKWPICVIPERQMRQNSDP